MENENKFLLFGLILMSASHSTLYILYPVVFDYGETVQIIASVVMVFLIIMFLIFFATTLGTISWLYLAEIMTELGWGIAVALNWVLVIIVSYIPSIGHGHKPKSDLVSSEDENRPNDISVFFLIFSGWWMMGFFLVLLYLRDTFKLNSEQILNLYSEREYDPLLPDPAYSKSN